MGRNLDLCMMLGVPERVDCPRCAKDCPSFFDDYDIDCGNPNPCAGEWCLSVSCPRCQHEWFYAFDVHVKVSGEDGDT